MGTLIERMDGIEENVGMLNNNVEGLTDRFEAHLGEMEDFFRAHMGMNFQ